MCIDVQILVVVAMRPVNASVASLSTVVFKSSQPASIPPLVETFYANTSFHRTTFTLSHLGGGDPVSSCKALHIGTSFDKCSSMPTRQCLQVPSMCQLTYFQVVHWEGQSNDMCHQVAHPSQMEERVAQEPCLISTYVKWSSHAHNCRPSCPSQLSPLPPFTTVISLKAGIPLHKVPSSMGQGHLPCSPSTPVLMQPPRVGTQLLLPKKAPIVTSGGVETSDLAVSVVDPSQTPTLILGVPLDPLNTPCVSTPPAATTLINISLGPRGG
jgi:hypothetical protein